MRLRFASLLLLGALPLLALGQNAPPAAAPPSLADSFRNAPSGIEIKDLPESFRGVAFEDGMGINPLFIFGLAMGSSGDDTAEQVFLTLLGVTLVDPDEFAALLEGKRPRIRGYTLDVNLLFRSVSEKGRDGRSTRPTLRLIETWVEGGRVPRWTAHPELSRDALLKPLQAAEQADAAKPTGISRAQGAATAIMIYMADYDDRLPAADSTAQAQKAVAPYAKSAEVWKSANPRGGRLLFNTALARRSAPSLGEASQRLLLWDENAWPDGGRVAAFLDGRARYVSAGEWEGIWSMESALRRRAKGPLPMTAAPAAPGP